jgi:hypothetical protein
VPEVSNPFQRYRRPSSPLSDDDQRDSKRQVPPPLFVLMAQPTDVMILRGLAPSTTAEGLKSFVAQFGAVKDVKFVKNRDTGVPHLVEEQ